MACLHSHLGLKNHVELVVFVPMTTNNQTNNQDMLIIISIRIKPIWTWQKKYGKKINNASSLQKWNWKQISTKHPWHKITKQQHTNEI